MRETLDRIEEKLARATSALAQPRTFWLAAVGLVAIAFLVRLPLVARATDVCCGHPDSWVYFHQAYVEYLRGNFYPDGHRGSGWQLLLFATLWLFGFSPGAGWTAYATPMSGEAAEAALVAHTLSAALSVGAVVATILLARELVRPAGALLAGALVALDPFLLRSSTASMSEPLYVPLFVLATLTVLHARRRPAWLLVTGALMALAHMLKVNGLVMYGMLGVWAWILFARDAREKGAKEAKGAKTDDGRRFLGLSAREVRWGVASVLAFALVAAPYLAWRGSELSSPFDYGTNQRFWADDLWDLGDEWWTAYTPEEGAPRETMRDYFAEHSWRDAALRLWQSIEWQVFDLFGSGRWPAQEEEGGLWVGSPQEESALTPLVAALSLVAAFTAMRRPEWWSLPLALAFTFLTFLWIYPLVRSVRYFAPLIPLFSIAAVAGWSHLATLVRRPHVAGALVFGAYFTLYGAVPLLHVPEGLSVLSDPEARTLVLALGALWTLVLLAPLAPGAWRRARGTLVARREREPDAG